jgi:Protein of unknown function (DUF3096)
VRNRTAPAGNRAYFPHERQDRLAKRNHCYNTQSEPTMNMNITIAPLIALIAGIIILVAPRFLNYIVAIYLIIIGLLGLFGGSNFHIR